MILVYVRGGLGNQLFQYACGRTLAKRLGTEFKLDLSWFETQNSRQYRLNDFNVIENIATPAEIELAHASTLKPPRMRDYLKPAGMRNYLRWLKKGRQWHYFQEPQLTRYYQAIDHITADEDVYLVGYWQFEKYFIDQAAFIRNEFKLTEPLPPENESLAAEMQNSQSVSIHIRRGDYVSDPRFAPTHNVCTPQYYQRAMQYISQKITTPRFYIFSDDPEWCQQNIHSDYPIKIVSNNQSLPQYDLILRAKCQHHILSNSTFSWWGAWLNNNTNKTVVVPDKWTHGLSTEERNIIPAHWNATTLSVNPIIQSS
ncbi:alpha-1,2-fucosyltransferase [Chloroflexota bacterium]